MTELFIERLGTPAGDLLIVTDEHDAVRAVEWSECEDRMTRLLRRYHDWRDTSLRQRPTHSPARHALAAYFTGRLGAIDGVVIADGGTPFQRRVWAALRSIPAGGTRSYGELASVIAQPRAARAVGLANGANPISVIVPCHRVIGRDGALTGYAGGLTRKHWLLAHERRGID